MADAGLLKIHIYHPGAAPVIEHLLLLYANAGAADLVTPGMEALQNLKLMEAAFRKQSGTTAEVVLIVPNGGLRLQVKLGVHEVLLFDVHL